MSASMSPSESPSLSPSASPSASPSISPSASPSVLIAGIELAGAADAGFVVLDEDGRQILGEGYLDIGDSVCWGHKTGVTQKTIRPFSGAWEGTGTIEGDIGEDNEKIALNDGEYMVSEMVRCSGTVTLAKNVYTAGDSEPALYWRTGATPAACEAATWSLYISSFTSSGYVQVKTEMSYIIGSTVTKNWGPNFNNSGPGFINNGSSAVWTCPGSAGEKYDVVSLMAKVKWNGNAVNMRIGIFKASDRSFVMQGSAVFAAGTSFAWMGHTSFVDQSKSAISNPQLDGDTDYLLAVASSGFWGVVDVATGEWPDHNGAFNCNPAAGDYATNGFPVTLDVSASMGDNYIPAIYCNVIKAA